MAPNEARKTLGYADLPKLGLSRREKARTLGYHQLPNGEINPTALGAPLTLAPKPVILGLELPAPPPPARLAPPPAPPRPAARQHLQLVPRTRESVAPVIEAAPSSAPRSTPRLELLQGLPVSKLTRAADVAPTSSSLLDAAAFDLVPRRRQATFGDPWFHRGPQTASEIDVDLEDQVEPVPGARVRSIVVRTLAALSFLACVAGAIYVAEQNPAARTAVTSWATLGQSK